MCGGFPSGIVQTSIFLTRNAGKTFTGKDTGRVGATVGQAVSLTESVAESSSIFGDKIAGGATKALSFADDGILKVADKLGCTDSIMKATAEAGTKSVAGAVARKAINPLLCVAAGIRVLNDDDQYAALIEESSAMGAMFAAEKLMKTQRNNFYKLTESAASTLKSAAKDSSGLKKLAINAAQKFQKLSGGKQTAVKIGLEVLFVAGSIAAYGIGKKVGLMLSHRDENQKA